MTGTDGRIEGVLADWDDARGFGFIDAPGHDGQIFFHVKFLRSRQIRPRLGDRVRFVVGPGRNDRPAALDAEIVSDAAPAPLSEKPAPAIQPQAAAIRRDSALDLTRLLAALFVVLAVAACVVTGAAPRWLAALYFSMGCISAGLYVADKRYAREKRWRVQENSLHFADLLFGIGGGLVAQHLLRHKTRKSDFRVTTQLVFLLHAAFLTLILVGVVDLDRLFG